MTVGLPWEQETPNVLDQWFSTFQTLQPFNMVLMPW